jgi:hypothetical protein
MFINKFLSLALITSVNGILNGSIAASWRKMSTAELHEWYDQTDICMLENAGNITSYEEFKDLKRTKCGGDNLFYKSGKLSLGFGASRALESDKDQLKLCTPLKYRSERYEQVLDGYSDPLKKHVVDTINNLKDNSTILFAGDSISRQSVYAFIAEVERQTSNKAKIYPSTFFTSLHQSKKLTPKFSHFDINPYTISAVGIELETGVIKVIYFLWFANPLADDKKMLQGLHSVLHDFQNFGITKILLIMNFGLWISEKKVYHEALVQTFDTVEKFHLRNNFTIRLIWRETTVNHFDKTNRSSTAGYIPSSASERSSTTVESR